jgi:hypothetical protein
MVYAFIGSMKDCLDVFRFRKTAFVLIITPPVNRHPLQSIEDANLLRGDSDKCPGFRCVRGRREAYV